MSDALREKISSLRIRARSALILHGIGWGLTIGIVILLCTALVDFYLRQDNRFSRITLSLSVLLAIVLVALRFVLPPLRRRLTDVALAQRIQNRFPKLQNKVASAVEFSKQRDDDTLAGSAAMRQAVIDEANSDLAQISITEVVRYRAAVTAGIAAVVSLAVVLAFAIYTPTGSSIALARLTNPSGNSVCLY
jgi:hypothetical protein